MKKFLHLLLVCIPFTLNGQKLRSDRKDLSIRKMQFFDYYLKGAPIPYRMKYGISLTEKGKKDGYELIDE
jgi:hypothetical protein